MPGIRVCRVVGGAGSITSARVRSSFPAAGVGIKARLRLGHWHLREPSEPVCAGRKQDRDTSRHLSRAKEVQRSRRAHESSRQERGQSIDPGPMVYSFHQVILDRVGRGVDQLVHHRLGTDG